ncbi:PRA1 family protein 2-like [Pristis pectinata]|uniref:PRA1 family protein 2-like n=1 Tax=Pristis pectinata TaxID=685728 RepID=UPI00223E8823|nr:PRA1 family protein 2-like [Pristis pectinata]
MARNAEVQLPPFRTLDDFLCSSARFSLPDLKDPLRWNNRVINNLLYYQTNYLATVAGILLLVGYMEPLQTVLGGAVVSLCFLGFVWSAENKAVVRRLRRNHPTLCMVGLLGASYCLLSVLGGVAVFLFGITFPMLLIVLHASLRLRNLKNKLENKIESIGLKRTPMGILLEALGQEQEAGS